jgi:hypothetical protein
MAMNRILKFASLSVVVVALPFAWRVGVFESAQQKESKHFEALAKEYAIENYYVREGFFRDQVELNPEFKDPEARGWVLLTNTVRSRNAFSRSDIASIGDHLKR